MTKVEYYRISDTHAEFAKAVEQFFLDHLMHTGSQYDGHIDDEVYYDGADDFYPFLSEADIFSGIKDDGFCEEEEWRLVLGEQEILPGEMMFDHFGRYPIPRARKAFYGSENNLKDTLLGIMAGPGADQERARMAFSILSQRFRVSLPLRFSTIPFRSA